MIHEQLRPDAAQCLVVPSRRTVRPVSVRERRRKVWQHLLTDNPAPGGPGAAGMWSRADKDAVGTAYSSASQLVLVIVATTTEAAQAGSALTFTFFWLSSQTWKEANFSIGLHP